MPDFYDVLTIAAISDELSATIGNGRIQRIGLVDIRTIGAEIYAGGHRHYLLASADDQQPRLRLTPEMPSLDPALTTPFGLLLRKHARGGVILSIDQPPLERLVRFSIARRQAPTSTGKMALAEAEVALDDEAGADELLGEGAVALQHVHLYVELMGRRSNLILVADDGRIMDSAKRVTPAMSRARPILPRLPYTLPPVPDRLDPREITTATAAQLLGALPPNADLARELVTAFRGISPVMSREIAYRIAGSPETEVGAVGPNGAELLVAATQSLLEPLQSTTWDPRVYRERGEGNQGAVVAFTPVPMTHLAAAYDEDAVQSVSAAAALAETDRATDSGRHVQRRQRLLNAIAAAREKVERRLAALAAESKRATEAERLKTSGELIYAYLWQIAPGQTELSIDGQTIALDPNLSPSENAQAYFERYRKAQSAAAHLPALQAESHAELAYLDQLATLVSQAPGFAELEALAAEWSEHATPPESAKRPNRKAAPRRPKALVDSEGNSVYIGRSGPQNDLVTFDIAGPDDTWLHARGVGGSHVIIRWRSPGLPEREETVAAAAALAAWYSAARDSGAVEVDVARRRHVRKIKGARPGMVTYRNERTIRVQPMPENRLRETLSEP